MMKISNIMVWNLKIGLLIAVSFVLTCFFRVIILALPFKLLAGFIGVEGIETRYCLPRQALYRIRIIRWAVTKVSRHTPWKSLCMVQALTAQLLLRCFSISSTLYLGLSKSEDKLSAHAWLRSGPEIVTGKVNMDSFRTVIFYGSIMDESKNSLSMKHKK
jgi:hypothetical protein